jgi:hypothetical protein
VLRIATHGIPGSLEPGDFQYISALPQVGGQPIVIITHGPDMIPRAETFKNGQQEMMIVHDPEQETYIYEAVEHYHDPIILHFSPPAVDTNGQAIGGSVGHYTLIRPTGHIIDFGHYITYQPEYQPSEYTELPPS